MLRTYALSPEILRKMLGRTLMRFQGFTTLSFLVFGLYLVLFGRPINWPVAGPMFGLVALAYFFVLFLHYRQQTRLLYSIRYEIDGSGISYRQIGREPMRIMRADITNVIPRKDGLLLHTVANSPDLFVPYGLARDGDEDLRRTLGYWTGSMPGRVATRSTNLPSVLIAWGGALLVLLFANSLAVIVPLGLFVLLYGLYTERRMGSVHHISPGVARTYSMAYTFLLFVIMAKTCMLGVDVFLLR